jgi:hypothetical protein
MLYIRYYIDASCKVWFNLAKNFRGEDVLTVANQKKELLLAAMFVGQMEPYEEAL